MRSINKVILIGNLTRDPEMRNTPSGQSVVTFGIATNREWVTKDGRKQSSAEYHDLVAWAKLADICHQYLKKGKLVYVEGYLKTRSWDTPEGVKKFRTEIVVQDMIMLDKKGEGEDYFPDREEASEVDELKEETPAKEETVEEETTEEDTETPGKVEEEAPVTKKDPPKEKEEAPAPEEKDEKIAAAPSDKKLEIDSDLGL